MSGFAGARVGFPCREIYAPDIHLINGINDMDLACRVCRVLWGNKRSGETNERRKAVTPAQPIQKMGLE
jgi:hypothetical protein